MKGSPAISTRGAANRLRNSLTDAEQKLWRRLRSNQLGVKFRRQHPFRNFVLDFVCLEQNLVVEVDGGQHADQQDADRERTAKLEQAGFRVLRFWNNEVLNQTDDVVAEIFRQLTPSPPQPSP